MLREPDVGFDPGSPGSRPGPKAGAKPLRHPGIPLFCPFVCVWEMLIFGEVQSLNGVAAKKPYMSASPSAYCLGSTVLRLYDATSDVNPTRALQFRFYSFTGEGLETTSETNGSPSK